MNAQKNKTILEKFPGVSGFDFTSNKVALNHGGRNWVSKNFKNITPKLLKKHFSGEQTMALPKYPHSKYLIFDIDQRSQLKTVRVKKIVDQIIKDFGFPFYIERSSQTGNYHLYYEMEEYLSKKGISALLDYYGKNYGYIIEVVHDRKVMRLPFSSPYQQKAFTYKNEKIEEVERLLEVFASHELSPLPSWLKKENTFGDPISKRRDVNKDGGKDKVSPHLFYGAGDRHEKQPRIGLETIRLYGPERERFYELCEYYNDGTSKDMKKNLYERNQILDKVWDWCLTHYDDSLTFEKTEEGMIVDYYGNFKFLNKSEFSFDDEEYKKLEKILTFFFRRNKIGKINSKYEKRFILDAIILLEAAESKRLYDEETNAHYSKEEFSKFSNATLLTHNLKKNIAKFYKIKNGIKVWRFLESIRAITPVYIGKYTHSYKGTKRFGKHYRIKRVSHLYNRYMRIRKNHQNLKNLKRTPIIYNYINKNININNINSLRERKKNNINYSTNFLLQGKSLDERLEAVRKWKKTKPKAYLRALRKKAL